MTKDNNLQEIADSIIRCAGTSADGNYHPAVSQVDKSFNNGIVFCLVRLQERGLLNLSAEQKEDGSNDPITAR